MRKSDIIKYLEDNLINGVDYFTETWFIDKKHSRLLSFSCNSLVSLGNINVVVDGK